MSVKYRENEFYECLNCGETREFYPFPGTGEVVCGSCDRSEDVFTVEKAAEIQQQNQKIMSMGKSLNLKMSSEDL